MSAEALATEMTQRQVGCGSAKNHPRVGETMAMISTLE
jgi:hypothetical protein